MTTPTTLEDIARQAIDGRMVGVHSRHPPIVDKGKARSAVRAVCDWRVLRRFRS